MLEWAEKQKERTGRFPTVNSGDVAEAPGESWVRIDRWLRVGGRGLAGGSSLARLQLRERGKPTNSYGDLTVDRVLTWVDAYQAEHGAWPSTGSGAVTFPGAPRLPWSGVDQYVRKGGRGLPGGSNLRQLLGEHWKSKQFSMRNSRAPKLSDHQIIAWAYGHRSRTGEWPHCKSRPVLDAIGKRETWPAIHIALYLGHRGLPGGSSLSKLLQPHRDLESARTKK